MPLLEAVKRELGLLEFFAKGRELALQPILGAIGRLESVFDRLLDIGVGDGVRDEPGALGLDVSSENLNEPRVGDRLDGETRLERERGRFEVPGLARRVVVLGQIAGVLVQPELLNRAFRDVATRDHQVLRPEKLPRRPEVADGIRDILNLATERPGGIGVVLDGGGGLVNLRSSNGPNGSRHEHHRGDCDDQPLVLPQRVHDLTKVELRFLYGVILFSGFSDGAPRSLAFSIWRKRSRHGRSGRCWPGSFESRASCAQAGPSGSRCRVSDRGGVPA